MIENSYNFSMPRKVLFGWGRSDEIAELVRPFGNRIHIICGSRTLYNSGKIRRMTDLLTRNGLEVADVELQTGEPTVENVDRLTQKFLSEGVSANKGDVFLGIGGGSAMDLTKAVAAMVPNFAQAESVRDFLEGVGKNLKIVQNPLPKILVPSTAGSGAEATKNAVIASYDPPFKKSLRDERLFAEAVLIDPEWTVTNSPEVTACSGLDALTQLFESFISKKATPIPQALALQGLRVGFPSLEIAWRDPTNQEAREKMAHAAFLSGVALANAGLGLAHRIAPALGTHARISHGKACAMLLPKALRVNAEVCGERLATLARTLFPTTFFSNTVDAVQKLIYEVNLLTNTLLIPRRLSELGVREEQLPEIAADSKGNSMSGNPKTLTKEDVLEILREML